VDVFVISRKRLREFWQTPGCEGSEPLLAAWHKTVEAADWDKFADVKAVFGSVDQVGNCLVFDIGNNRYRLIARIIYPKRRVYVLKVMTHKEYDKQKWPDQCGCHKPPPRPKPQPAPAKPKKGKR
jgi:mRNA interferase HigB